MWEEETADLPGFPKDENLLEFQVDQPGSKFRYFIDTASISVGEDDGVVRYTLVIRSKSGGQNVMFEAMHCTERQYKTFAYGTSKGEFRPLRKPRWRSIRETSNVRYRRDLWEYYLCDFETRKTRLPEQIIDAIRYPRENRPDTGF